MKLLTRVTSEAHLHHSHPHLLVCLAQEARRRTLQHRQQVEWRPLVVYSEAHSKKQELVCLDLRRRRRIQQQPSLVRPEDCSAAALNRLSKPPPVVVVVCLAMLQPVSNSLNRQPVEDYLAAILPRRNSSSRNSRQVVVFLVRQQSTPRLLGQEVACSGSHKQSHQEAYCKLHPSPSLDEFFRLLVVFSISCSGQAQAQQPQATNQVPAVQINYDNLRPRTRFDDLAKPVQDEIALIDKGIQRVIKMKDEIGEFMPQHEKDIEQLGRDVKFVETKFKTVQVALNQDILTVKVLQDMTKKNIADAQLSFKATDNLKLPTHYHQTGLFAGPTPAADSNGTDAASAHASAQDLITYFNRICDDVEKYKKRLDEYRGEIERDMPGVENGLYEQIRTIRDRNAAVGGAVQDQLGQVLSALRETGNAIVAQAGQIADTRERLSRLQAGILDSGVYAMGMAG